MSYYKINIIKLNYKTMEKQACVLVQSLKHFRPYVGYLKIIAYILHVAMKDILTQQDCLGIHRKWVSKIQEYDLDIRPTKLVKGQGLAKMLVEGNEKTLNVNVVSNVLDNLEKHEWYMDIIYYLKKFTCPIHLLDHKRRALRLKVSKYCIIKGGLGWKNPDGLVLCGDDEEAKRLMEELHNEFCGRHHLVQLNCLHFVLIMALYCPTHPTIIGKWPC